MYLLTNELTDWTTFPLGVCTFVLLLCYMVPISLVMSIQTASETTRNPNTIAAFSPLHSLLNLSDRVGFHGSF